MIARCAMQIKGKRYCFICFGFMQRASLTYCTGLAGCAVSIHPKKAFFGINCWFTGSNQEKLCRTRQSLHFTPYLCARYEKFGRRF
ncbi:hypothetical protein B6N25_05195 [Sphingobacteriales bacterium TSM_CSS]|nr:hypothetical protein B6N25_05195 [Sphingobacteriales bacterium TSM_CSS]